jgi:hypothetical protein
LKGPGGTYFRDIFNGGVYLVYIPTLVFLSGSKVSQRKKGARKNEKPCVRR